MPACSDDEVSRGRGSLPMLIAAFGLPGPFASRGFAALQEVVRPALGEPATVAADSLEAFLAALDGPADRPVLLLSHYPQPCLAAHAEEHAAHRIVFREPTRRAVRYLAETTSEEDMAMIRAVARSCACLASLPDPERWLALHGDDTGADDRTLAATLAARLGLPPTPGGPLGGSDVRTAGPAAPDEEADTPMRPLAEAILGPFDRRARGKRDAVFAWPHECFLGTAELGQPLRGPVDLTGGARCIVYGPYLHLPAGRWAAQVTLGFDAQVYDQSLVLELHGADLLARIRVAAPSSAGLFGTELSFEVTRPEVPLELRVLTERGAIEGRLTRIDVSIVAEPWAPTPPVAAPQRVR